MLPEIVSEEPFKKGNRLHGHYVTCVDGTKVYLARRKHGQIFRSGYSSISEAMSEEEAAWMIDETHLFNARARGCKLIGVRVIDTGDLYVTELSNYFDLRKAKIRSYSEAGRGGSRQRYLPLIHFHLTKARVDLLAPL